MRNSFLLLAVLTLSACTDKQPSSAVPPGAGSGAGPAAPVAVPPPPGSGMVQLHSLAGSGLRFDGVYDAPTSGNIHYFLRFFPRGNVALVAGRQEPSDPVDLRSYLTEDVKSGTNNIHNVPVTHRGDSLFFTTMASRGAITYEGMIVGDSLRFMKHSKATGKKALVTYGFYPDTAPLP